MEQKKAAGAGFGEKFPAGMKVMVVDDDPLCLKMVESLLKRCSYNGALCREILRILINRMIVRSLTITIFE